MRGTKFGIIALAAAGLVLAGCSSDGEGTTPQASLDSDSPAPDDSPSEEGTDGGGEPSAEFVGWAGDLCDVSAPLQDEMAALTEDFTPDPEDPLAGMSEALAKLGPAFATAADAIERIGPPPIDGGQEAFDALIAGFRDASDVYASLEDQLSELDPADPNFQEQMTAIFSGLGEDLQESSQVIDDVFSSPEMSAAFEAAPECALADMGQ